MKLIASKLYLDFSDAIQCGMNEKYLSKAKSVGNKSFTFINDPADKRKVLIEFDALKPVYKEMVQKRFGNPYEHLAKEPIKNMVSKDLKAEEFYLAYRYDGNKYLPIETVNKYIAAASWLNMLVKAEANKKDIKKLLNLSLADFWLKVCEIIKAESIDLPTGYKRLREKMVDYQANSYSSLIHKHFGNSHAKKVSSEVAESLLLELISQPYHDDAVICRRYNEWAIQNDHEPITPATVGNYKRKNASLLMAEKRGTKDWYNTYGKQIMRKRPSAPLLLIGSDDNDLDLYFQDIVINKKSHTTTNYYHRFKLIVVMDAFNDYILGYAFGDTVTADLVKLAFLDAVHHMKDLTGGWYLPHQLQTDNWGRGTLDSFYESIATYTPATAKVARAKYIEQAFGTKWHQQLALYPNYAGNNITAKSKINEDRLALNKKNFPHKELGSQQIEHFIDSMRNLVSEKTGLTRQQEWLNAFQQSPKSQERRIDDLQMLHLFGKAHDYQNQITNRGITPAINCVERTYEIPEEFYMSTVGKKVQVIYDPLDYSRILVTGEGVRFIAREYELMPSAIADYKPGDRARLNDRLNEKKRHVEMISQQKEKRQGVLDRAKINAESYLQAGVMPKELMQGAVQLLGQSKNNDKNYDPLDQI